jgi:hypothetical protein
VTDGGEPEHHLTSPQGSGPPGQSGVSPIGTVQQNDQREFVVPHRPETDSRLQVSRSPAEELDRPEIPIEVSLFCPGNGIEREIEAGSEVDHESSSHASERR